MTIAAIPGIKVVGIMTHDGTLCATSDRESMITEAKRTSVLMVEVGNSITRAGVIPQTILPKISMKRLYESQAKHGFPEEVVTLSLCH